MAALFTVSLTTSKNNSNTIEFGRSKVAASEKFRNVGFSWQGLTGNNRIFWREKSAIIYQIIKRAHL